MPAFTRNRPNRGQVANDATVVSTQRHPKGAPAAAQQMTVTGGRSLIAAGPRELYKDAFDGCAV
jgi:hypothetical protein